MTRLFCSIDKKIDPWSETENYKNSKYPRSKIYLLLIGLNKKRVSSSDETLFYKLKIKQLIR